MKLLTIMSYVLGFITMRCYASMVYAVTAMVWGISLVMPNL